MDESKQQILTSADLTIDCKSGSVSSKQGELRLAPVNMRVLQVLLAQQGSVVSRAEIFDSVWKNQVVSDDALTRCISDLRSQLGKLSSTDTLIETLPKKGYRWLPSVAIAQVNKEPLPTKQSTQIIKNIVLVLSGLILLTFITLLLINHWAKTDTVRIALLPIAINDQQLQQNSEALEEKLKMALLNAENLKLLSVNAVNSRPNNPFPYLSRQFGVKWLIEGSLRQDEEKLRLSLSLVDAQTAIVFHTISQDIQYHEINEPNMGNKLIAEFEAVINFNQ